MSRRKRKTGGSHSHDLVTAIDVDHLTGDRCGAVAGEKNPGRAYLCGITTAFQWRAFLIMFEHRAEPADAARGQRLNRSRRNAIYPDFFRAEIVGEIARAGFEARFGY